jgi:hypothetical protein
MFFKILFRLFQMLIEAILIFSYHFYNHYHPMVENDFNEEIRTKSKNNQKHRTTALLYSFLLGTFGADWYKTKIVKYPTKH